MSPSSGWQYGDQAEAEYFKELARWALESTRWTKPSLPLQHGRHIDSMPIEINAPMNPKTAPTVTDEATHQRAKEESARELKKSVYLSGGGKSQCMSQSK